jgi:hypothetical protein
VGAGLDEAIGAAAARPLAANTGGAVDSELAQRQLRRHRIQPFDLTQAVMRDPAEPDVTHLGTLPPESRPWEQLEQVRKSVEAQLHWAVLHDGDEELLELLLFERDRLSALMAHRRVGEGDDQGL